MDCAAILERLSEYIDGTLDVQTRKAVEKHISVCENCKQEFASLRAVVEELGALEPVKPPEDFLEKIHERVETRSGFNKIFRKLFVPFHIKIPLELAAAATVTIFVVLVLNIQQPEIQRESKLSSSFMAKAESKQAAGKGHPIELALVLKTDVIGGTLKPGIAMHAAPLLESDESTVEKESDHIDSFERRIDAREKYRSADLLARIKHIIDREQGKILIVKYDEQAKQLQSIDIEIPAQSYKSFCTRLTGLATFQNPRPVLSDKDLKTIQVRIRFLSD